MKRIISLMMAAFLALAVFSGCSEDSGKEHILYVGFGRADISPTEPITVGNTYFGVNYLSDEVLDPLYATCIAFTDENNNTILLYHMDLGGVHDYVAYARGQVAKKLNMSQDQIMVAATHTHCVPNGEETVSYDGEWKKSFTGWMLEAAQEALADRKPAQMQTTSIECENMNFVRHYIMSDGSYAGNNFGDTTGKTHVAHTEEADKTLQLIKGNL